MIAPPLLPYLEGVERVVSGGEEGTEASLRLRGVLAAGDPIYAGHFPGQPILPAIAQLELLRAVASLAAGRPVALTRIEALKLRKTVGPGEALQIELRPPAIPGPRAFLQLTGAGGAVVSGGTFAFAPADEALSSDIALGLPQGGLSDPGAGEPSLLLPHAPPALFLLPGAATFEGGLAAPAAVPAGHALVSEGYAPSFAALEAGAQAAGLLEALGRSGGEAPPAVGYIVGLRGVDLDPRPIAAGVPFRVTVRRSGGAGALAIYEVEAEAEGRPLLRGTVSAYLPGAAGDEGG